MDISLGYISKSWNHIKSFLKVWQAGFKAGDEKASQGDRSPFSWSPNTGTCLRSTDLVSSDFAVICQLPRPPKCISEQGDDSVFLRGLPKGSDDPQTHYSLCSNSHWDRKGGQKINAPAHMPSGIAVRKGTYFIFFRMESFSFL